MIISVNGREKKIAILKWKSDRILHQRGEENSGIAGNIYKGRVMRVLPGMQSAFVDYRIGSRRVPVRHGFLSTKKTSSNAS